MQKQKTLWTKITALAFGATLAIGIGANILSLTDERQRAYAAEGDPVASYYLVGSINSWNLEDTTYPLARIGNSTIYQWTGVLYEDDEFKLNTTPESGDWTGVIDYDSLTGECKGTVMTSAGGNIKVGKTYGYRITYDSSSSSFEANYQYYLVGSMNSWSLEDRGYPFLRVGSSSVYQCSRALEVGVEFKLNINGTWDSAKTWSDLGGVCRTDGSLEEPWYETSPDVWVTDHNIKVKVYNSFKISYNPTSGDFDIGYNNDEYYLVGSMNSWALRDENYHMTNIGSTLFQWVGTLSTSTELKLDTSGGWAGAMGYDGATGPCKADNTINTPSGNNIKANVGKVYRLTFDTSTGFLTVEPDVTKRVWFDPSLSSDWSTNLGDDLIGIHYWDASVDHELPGTSWPGLEMKYDTANSLWYYDVPNEVSYVKFSKIDGDNLGVALDKSIDVELPTYPGVVKFAFDGNQIESELVVEGQNFLPNVPTVVVNFAQTIDTKEEACTVSALESAVTTYTCFTTYEKEAFNDYAFGASGETGEQIIAYLTNYFSYDEPLSLNNLGTISNRDISIIIIISVIFSVALVGFYIFIRKRKTN